MDLDWLPTQESQARVKVSKQCHAVRVDVRQVQTKRYFFIYNLHLIEVIDHND